MSHLLREAFTSNAKDCLGGHTEHVTICHARASYTLFQIEQYPSWISDGPRRTHRYTAGSRSLRDFDAVILQGNRLSWHQLRRQLCAVWAHYHRSPRLASTGCKSPYHTFIALWGFAREPGANRTL